MQMLVLPSSTGFAPVAPMLAYSVAYPDRADILHSRWQIQKEKMGKLMKDIFLDNKGLYVNFCYSTTGEANGL